MYLINRLNKKVLITPQEVIFHAPIGHTIDERSLLQNIIVAEQRFIAPIIGRDLYEEMVAQKNTAVTSGNQTSMLSSINAYLTTVGDEGVTSTDLPVGSLVNASETLSAANLTLWNEHLWKLIAECVEYMAIVPTWLQHTAQGQQMNNPQTINGGSSQTGALQDIKYKGDKFLQDRIDPLIESMKYFLCKYQTTYPLYTCEDTSIDGISVNRKSAMVFDIYDDDEATCSEW